VQVGSALTPRSKLVEVVGEAVCDILKKYSKVSIDLSSSETRLSIAEQVTDKILRKIDASKKGIQNDMEC
tara:strand:+ start:456 stop:665 length:210 start_codon:yes stop_codon:yes gene_type:complete